MDDPVLSAVWSRTTPYPKLDNRGKASVRNIGKANIPKRDAYDRKKKAG